MGAAGKKREEELLSQIEALKKQVAERDGTISDLESQIAGLQN